MIINNHKIAPGENLTCASLTGANLTGADLSGADLANTNLTGANLTEADLSGANLTDANLKLANLINANLTCANLTRANLAGAGLAWANLTGATLTEADLANTNLTGANLTGTCLDPEAPVPYLTDKEILDAGLEIEGDLVYGWRTKTSIHCGYTMYELGECHEAPWFSVCRETSCHSGIYLASKEWLDHEYGEYSRVRCYCRRDELIHARDKWRCKRLWVVAS